MIRFACTHLDAQRSDTNRVLQIQKIVDVLKQEKLPVILAGDLNAVSGSSVIEHLDKYFTRTCIENCGFTIPEINPTKTIDFIAFTPGKFDVATHGVIEEIYASDHRPIVAVLKY
jgi:endonuclease/exonuclease/phosphatase family metal-dependent hydrolase